LISPFQVTRPFLGFPDEEDGVTAAVGIIVLSNGGYSGKCFKVRVFKVALKYREWALDCRPAIPLRHLQQLIL
jgi:hypothetical protein